MERRRIEWSGTKLVACIALGIYLAWIAQITTTAIAAKVVLEYQASKQQSAAHEAEKKRQAAEAQRRELEHRQSMMEHERRERAKMQRLQDGNQCRFWREQNRSNRTRTTEEKVQEYCPFGD